MSTDETSLLGRREEGDRNRLVAILRYGTGDDFHFVVGTSGKKPGWDVKRQLGRRDRHVEGKDLGSVFIGDNDLVGVEA